MFKKEQKMCQESLFLARQFFNCCNLANCQLVSNTHKWISFEIPWQIVVWFPLCKKSTQILFLEFLKPPLCYLAIIKGRKEQGFFGFFRSLWMIKISVSRTKLFIRCRASNFLPLNLLLQSPFHLQDPHFWKKQTKNLENFKA